MLKGFWVGVIFFEIVTNQVMFNGTGDLEQLQGIFRVCGTPHEGVWPGVSSFKNYRNNFRKFEPNLNSKIEGIGLGTDGEDLLKKMLVYDPLHRISAVEALKHEYFNELTRNI